MHKRLHLNPRWLAISLLIMAAIFAFSCKSGEASNSFSDALVKLLGLERFLGSDHASGVPIIFGLTVRKFAHMFEYCLLAIAVSAAFRRISLSIPICGLYAALDELHQYFVAGRTARLYDVGIDMIGVLIGIAIFAGIRLLTKSPKKL